jgi:hypothetical protein
MTMPMGSTEEPEVLMIGHQSLPVHVVSSDAKPGKTIAPEFGRFRSFLVANVVGPYSITPGAQRILNRSLRRYEARIKVNGSAYSLPNGGTSYASENGAVTSPAAGGVLATTGVVPAGTYSVMLYLSMAGTPAQGTDNNNVRLNVNNATYTIVPNNIGTAPQQFGPFTVTTDGIHAILAQANAAGTAGSIYAAQVVATPEAAAGNNSATDGILIGGREEITSGAAANIGSLGGYLQIGDNITYRAQQELWVCYPASNAGPVYVTVLDMQYASDPDAYREFE